jgi:hypothetical protein
MIGASCHCGAFAINGRCFAPQDVVSVAVRQFDGADTWKYLD